MEKETKHIEETSASDACDKTQISGTTEKIDILANDTHKNPLDMEVMAENKEEATKTSPEIEIEKESITETFNSPQHQKSITTNKVFESKCEPQKDSSEMEGALKRLSLTENIKVKTEATEVAIVSIKNLEQNQPEVLSSVAKSPIITPANTSELKIAQVQGNVKLSGVSPALTNRPSEIRITQVQSFHSNPIQRPHLIIQRRTSEPPPLNGVGVRSSVPRITNVTSLRRPQPMQNHRMHSQHRIPLPNPTRPTLFEESKRFKYREEL